MDGDFSLEIKERELGIGSWGLGVGSWELGIENYWS